MSLGEKTVIKLFKIQGVYEVGGGGIWTVYKSGRDKSIDRSIFDVFSL